MSVSPIVCPECGYKLTGEDAASLQDCPSCGTSLRSAQFMPGEDLPAAPSQGSRALETDISVKSLLFSFRGRISRKQWWIVYLAAILAQLLMNSMAGAWATRAAIFSSAANRVLWFAVAAVMLAAMLVITWVQLAALVKRLHDLNINAWWPGGAMVLALPYLINSAVPLPWPRWIPLVMMLPALILSLTAMFGAGSAVCNDYGVRRPIHPIHLGV